MSTEHLNPGVNARSRKHRHAATNDGDYDESWALALLNECESMDKATLLRPSPAPRHAPSTAPLAHTTDAPIYVEEGSPSAAASHLSAIEKQVRLYQRSSAEQLQSELTAAPAKPGWRERIKAWFG